MGLANVVKSNLGTFLLECAHARQLGHPLAALAPWMLQLPLCEEERTGLTNDAGPRGTLKMLVDGSGQLKMTKDGKVLLSEMQIQVRIVQPAGLSLTAAEPHGGTHCAHRSGAGRDDWRRHDLCRPPCRFVLEIIAVRALTSIPGELLKQAERYTSEGVHPRVLADGVEVAKNSATAFLDSFKIPFSPHNPSHETLVNVAFTSLSTKLHKSLASALAKSLVDAVLAVRQVGRSDYIGPVKAIEAPKETVPGEPEEVSYEPIDLHMVELMKMQHLTDVDTRLVKGLVLDHGARHPDMPKRLENCFILTLNVSLEYEKTCVPLFAWDVADAHQRGQLGLLLLVGGAAREARRVGAQIHRRQGAQGDRAQAACVRFTARQGRQHDRGEEDVCRDQPKGHRPLELGYARKARHHGATTGQEEKHGEVGPR